MPKNNINICKGAGCKAWSSDQVARELMEIREGLNLNKISVCRVSCMNVCGGGASVRVNDETEVLKVKEVDDLINALGVGEKVFA